MTRLSNIRCLSRASSIENLDSTSTVIQHRLENRSRTETSSTAAQAHTELLPTRHGLPSIVAGCDARMRPARWVTDCQNCDAKAPGRTVSALGTAAVCTHTCCLYLCSALIVTTSSLEPCDHMRYTTTFVGTCASTVGSRVWVTTCEITFPAPKCLISPESSGERCIHISLA